MSSNWSSIARRIRVPLGFAMAVLYMGLAKPTLKSLLLGSVLVGLGIGIRAVASGHVQKNEALATSGPYAYTRNPLYLGSMVLASGFALAARSGWILGALAIMFAAIYIPVIRSEEDFLRQRFPEFEAYAARVPRLLPRLRTPEAVSGSFSWDLYRKHREYNAILGCALVTAALVAKLLWLP